MLKVGAINLTEIEIENFVKTHLKETWILGIILNCENI
jgi:hypothetical protein